MALSSGVTGALTSFILTAEESVVIEAQIRAVRAGPRTEADETRLKDIGERLDAVERRLERFRAHQEYLRQGDEVNSIKKSKSKPLDDFSAITRQALTALDDPGTSMPDKTVWLCKIIESITVRSDRIDIEFKL